MEGMIDIYHCRQYKEVNKSTQCFVDWLKGLGYLGQDKVQSICDMACGGGANTFYLSNLFKECTFTGIDLSEELIAYGNRQIEGQQNCKLYQGDWYDLGDKWKDKFDGIISFQTLSWLPEYETAIKNLTLLNPEWIAISSLFYEGDIEYSIKLKNYYRPTEKQEFSEAYYNIYSILRIRKYLESLGYRKFDFKPFEIDIDLPKPDSFDIGTYTIKTKEDKRLQVSAALLMPWYFIVASK